MEGKLERKNYRISTIINAAKKTANWSESLKEALENLTEIQATDEWGEGILGAKVASHAPWQLYKTPDGEMVLYIEQFEGYAWVDEIIREELERDEESGRLTEDGKRTLENYRLNDEIEAIGEEVRAKILGEEPKRESETLKAMKREETLAWRRIADLQKRLKMECENLTGTDATVANQAAREIAWISSELKNETTRLELMTGIRERLEAEEKGE